MLEGLVMALIALVVVAVVVGVVAWLVRWMFPNAPEILVRGIYAIGILIGLLILLRLLGALRLVPGLS